MANAVARGQISFIDLNDGKALSLHLVANRATTQLHNLDGGTTDTSYTPNYVVDNLVITPTLYISGTTGNQLVVGDGLENPPQWSINNLPVNDPSDTDQYDPDYATNFDNGGVTFSTTKPYELTISRNDVLDTAQYSIVCSLNYYDKTTMLTTPITAQITITKITTAKGVAQAVAYAEGHTVFYNETDSNIVLHCDLWRAGETIHDDDNDDVSYQWYRRDNPGSEDTYDWYKIVSAYTGTGNTPAHSDQSDPSTLLPTGESWCECLNKQNGDPNGKVVITGFNTDDVSIDKDGILSYDSFMCVVTETEHGENPNAKYRSNSVSLLDWTDPYYIDWTATAGTTFTAGSTVPLVAVVHVWQRGQELSSSVQNTFQYMWTKRDKDGVLARGTAQPSADNYYSDYKFFYDGSDNNALKPDPTWTTADHLHDGGAETYGKLATGSDAARTISVVKEEVKLKATFFVEVYIP